MKQPPNVSAVRGSLSTDERAASSVIAVVFLVGLVVAAAAVVSLDVLPMVNAVDEPAPTGRHATARSGRDPVVDASPWANRM